MNFDTKGFEVIKNSVSIDIVDFLFEYFSRKRDVAKLLYERKYVLHNPTHMIGYWNDSQTPNTYSHYGDIAFDTLLEHMLPAVEEVVGMKLISSYSYARIYKHGDELMRHRDRPDCEISTTMFLGGDEWAIYMEGEPVLLQKGEMCVYKGCDLVHWRNKFEGEKCVQVFLHYQPFKENAKHDGREILGLPPEFCGNTLDF